MHFIRRRFRWLAAGMMLAALAHAPSVEAQSVPASGSKEAVVRVITQWTGGCSGDKRTSWDNMVDAWYDEITDDDGSPWGHGSKAWVRDGFYQNDNIVDSDFTDPDVVSWGNDHADDRPDDVDVCMIALHGQNQNGERYKGTVRVNEAGDGGCNADQSEMQYGDGDLEFLHFSSCESMNEESWYPEWVYTYRGLHQIDGWHGLMWINTLYNGRYRRFADDAFDIGIADSWIDNHYDNAWEFWQDYDHCPVPHGVGYSKSSVDTRLTYEEYDYVYDDIAFDDIRNVMVFYIDGCNPKSEDPL